MTLQVLKMDLEQIASGIAATSDGQHVHLMFNAGPFGELSEKQRSWIDGVGLYRTEFIFWRDLDFRQRMSKKVNIEPSLRLIFQPQS